MMLTECEGEDFEVRRRFAVMILILRGHKITPTDLNEQPYGLVGQCQICDQIVRVARAGTGIQGRAVENDCPAAEWRQP